MDCPDYYYELTDCLPTVTLANIVDIKPPYVHFRRQTDEFILYYILSGEMYLQQGDRQYVLREHEYIILDPRYVHVGYKSSVARFMYLHFKGGLKFLSTSEIPTEDSERLIIPGYHRLNSRESHVSLLSAGEETINSMRRNTLLSQSIAQANLRRVLLYLTMDYKYGIHLSNIDVKGRIRDIIPQIVKYLESNYSEEITGSTLEDKFNFHFDYMNRQFSKWTGSTIFNYLTKVRIDQARQLLATGIYSTKEVAAMTGFKDVSYFSKVFKKETGTTPGKWV